VLLAAGPAWAHVEVNPEQVGRGSTVDLTFHVPNEEDDASTIAVEIAFPTDHPIPSAAPKPMPGWLSDVETSGNAVTRVVWKDGLIQPGGEANFVVTVGPLPVDTDRVVFRALQTFDDGEVVRWIEEPQPGNNQPEHPAPVLFLIGQAPSTTAESATTSTAHATTTTTAAAAGEDDDDGPSTALVAALIVATALAAAGAGYAFSRRGRGSR
jgi:uncharacterized protein YcnI